VCRKHSIDPSMLTGWRESYETFGLECLRTHSTAIDTGLRKQNPQFPDMWISITMGGSTVA